MSERKILSHQPFSYTLFMDISSNESSQNQNLYLEIYLASQTETFVGTLQCTNEEVLIWERESEAGVRKLVDSYQSNPSLLKDRTWLLL